MKTVYLLLSVEGYHDFTDIDWKETIGVFSTLKEAKVQKKILLEHIKRYDKQDQDLMSQYKGLEYWPQVRKLRASFANDLKGVEKILMKKWLANTASGNDLSIEKIELLD
jgi:hypothetical protein